MNIEVTAKNTALVEQIGLHDVLLESMMWKFEGDSVTFKMSNWEWNNEGELTLQGVVYCEASALWLFNRHPGGASYINDVYVDDQFSIADLFCRLVKESKLSVEDCNIPNVGNYFCVTMFLDSGDFVRFVVEKLTWESASEK